MTEYAKPPMTLFGLSDPTGGDGYIPGAWDEVRSAYLDGHISEEAYELLHGAIHGPKGPMPGIVPPEQ